MGLFSRQRPNYEEGDLQSFEFSQPNRNQIPDKIVDFGIPSPQQETQMQKQYSIEDAILLMRDLPQEKKDLVVGIVAKTLESASVNISKIINDAQEKITHIENRTQKLDDEIREFEIGITQRKKEIASLQQDRSETVAVKASFESLTRNPEKDVQESTTSVPPKPTVAS